MAADYLVIDLYTDLTAPGWMRVDQGEVTRTDAYQEDPKEVTKRAVIVMVPASDVLLLMARLPTLHQARLMQALPYALEEQVADEVEALHFAIGTVPARGEVPVAVVAHATMQKWQALLQEWGVQADAILPVSLTLPYQASRWQVWVTEEQVVIRTGLLSGGAGERQNMLVLLTAAIQQTTALPDRLLVINETKQSCLAEIESLSVPVDEVFCSSEQVRDMMVREAIHPTLNLLQGRYTNKKRSPRQRGIRVGLSIGIAWGMVLFLYPILSYLILAQRMHHLTAQIHAIYHAYFPQASRMVAPKLRMEEKLRQWSVPGEGQQVLLWLAYVEQGISHVADIKLKRFQYQQEQLWLEVVTQTADAVQALTDYLTQQGLYVKQQHAAFQDKQMTTLLFIESHAPNDGGGQ